MGMHNDKQHIKKQRLRALYRATKTVKRLNGILLPMLRGRLRRGYRAAVLQY